MTINRLVKFAWRREERRQHDRVAEPPVTLVADRRKFTTLDWSLGGCRIKGEPGVYARSERFEGHLKIEGCPHGEFVAEVVRGTETGEYGLRWLEVTSATFVAMAELKAGQERWRRSVTV